MTPHVIARSVRCDEAISSIMTGIASGEKQERPRNDIRNAAPHEGEMPRWFHYSLNDLLFAVFLFDLSDHLLAFFDLIAFGYAFKGFIYTCNPNDR